MRNVGVIDRPPRPRSRRASPPRPVPSTNADSGLSRERDRRTHTVVESSRCDAAVWACESRISRVLAPDTGQRVGAAPVIQPGRLSASVGVARAAQRVPPASPFRAEVAAVHGARRGRPRPLLGSRVWSRLAPTSRCVRTSGIAIELRKLPGYASRGVEPGWQNARRARSSASISPREATNLGARCLDHPLALGHRLAANELRLPFRLLARLGSKLLGRHERVIQRLVSLTETPAAARETLGLGFELLIDAASTAPAHWRPGRGTHPRAPCRTPSALPGSRSAEHRAVSRWNDSSIMTVSRTEMALPPKSNVPTRTIVAPSSTATS